jgi:hypothetical protein
LALSKTRQCVPDSSLFGCATPLFRSADSLFPRRELQTSGRFNINPAPTGAVRQLAKIAALEAVRLQKDQSE